MTFMQTRELSLFTLSKQLAVVAFRHVPLSQT
jgi:hypothetical protein